MTAQPKRLPQNRGPRRRHRHSASPSPSPPSFSSSSSSSSASSSSSSSEFYVMVMVIAIMIAIVIVVAIVASAVVVKSRAFSPGAVHARNQVSPPPADGAFLCPVSPVNRWSAKRTSTTRPSHIITRSHTPHAQFIQACTLTCHYRACWAGPTGKHMHGVYEDRRSVGGFAVSTSLRSMLQDSLAPLTRQRTLPPPQVHHLCSQLHRRGSAYPAEPSDGQPT